MPLSAEEERKLAEIGRNLASESPRLRTWLSFRSTDPRLVWAHASCCPRWVRLSIMLLFVLPPILVAAGLLTKDTPLLACGLTLTVVAVRTAQWLVRLGRPRAPDKDAP